MLLLSSLTIVSVSFAAPEKFTIDTTSSVLEWTGKKVTGSHTGVLKLSDGSITMENGMPVAGEFTLNMGTIKNKDLADTKDAAKLERHLKSDDFFNVPEYPVGKFTLNSAEKTSETNYTITGELEIKGIKKAITFPATITQKDGVYTANADVVINRADWGIKYNSGSFFDIKKLGDKLIYDEIEIGLNITTEPHAG